MSNRGFPGTKIKYLENISAKIETGFYREQSRTQIKHLPEIKSAEQTPYPPENPLALRVSTPPEGHLASEGRMAF